MAFPNSLFPFLLRHLKLEKTKCFDFYVVCLYHLAGFRKDTIRSVGWRVQTLMRYKEISRPTSYGPILTLEYIYGAGYTVIVARVSNPTCKTLNVNCIYAKN